MQIIEALLLLSFLAVLFRLFYGPSPWDRLLSYNAASNRLIGLLALLAVMAGKEFYLDMIIVYAAVSFLGVLVIARFMERGELHR